MNYTTKIKKPIYLICTIALVFLMGFILYSMLELAYIKEVLAKVEFSANIWKFGFLWKAVSLWLRFCILLLGIVAGYFLGKYWWRIVYIERRHWRFRKEKLQKDDKN